METKRVTTIAELIVALGGPKAAGDILGASPQAVVNWRNDGTMPARKFLVHQEALRGEGIEAPATLWGMAEPAAA